MKTKKMLDLTKVRTRHEPPTLDEAVYAAQGLTPDIDHQVEITAQLIGQPESEVRATVLGARAPVTRSTNVRVAGSPRTVSVERRAPRSFPSRSPAN